MQITTYGQTVAPVEAIKPVEVSDPTAPSNPSAPSNPANPTPPAPAPPATPGGPVTIPNPTTQLPSTMSGMPVLMDMLNPNMTTVLQVATYNRARKEYYMAQTGNGSNGKREPYESTYISRLDDSGKYKDQMKLIDAGHGTSLVVENYGTKNTVYLWLSFSNQANAYYRFPYKTGTFKFSEIPSKTKLPKFTSGYATYHVDWEADVLMERVDNANTTMTLRKRKLSELLKGTDRVYATLTTEPVVTRQGWATINDSVYILQGATNGETLTPQDLSYLDTYNWSTGTRVDRANLQNLGFESDGTWKQNTHEPEGLSIYRDPTTKKASLLVGITTGIYTKGSSKHKWFLYRYSNIGNAP